MEMLIIFLVLISAHVFGDYAFQSAYIAESKGENRYHLLMHCWIYATCFAIALFIMNKLDFYMVLIIFVSHFIIDFLKKYIEQKLGNKAYIIDQILHYIVIVIVGILII